MGEKGIIYFYGVEEGFFLAVCSRISVPDFIHSAHVQCSLYIYIYTTSRRYRLFMHYSIEIVNHSSGDFSV